MTSAYDVAFMYNLFEVLVISVHAGLVKQSIIKVAA